MPNRHGGSPPMQKYPVGTFRKVQAALSLMLVVLGVLLFVRLAFAQTPETKNEFVIRNARIFDGSSVIPRGDVWVANGVIKAAGAHVQTPAGIRTIDGAGDTVLPGLIDAHTHAFGGA